MKNFGTTPIAPETTAEGDSEITTAINPEKTVKIDFDATPARDRDVDVEELARKDAAVAANLNPTSRSALGTTSGDDPETAASPLKTSTNNKFAAITGASSGIGYHLARVFAKNGFDVLVTAEDGKLADAVRDLESEGARVYSVQADLRKYDEVEKLWQAILDTGRPLDAIAINAGVGVGGDFARETELQDELDLIELNVNSSVHLAKRATQAMVERRQGRILITASIAGTMPTPLEAVYGASKAFLLEFAQSLRYELKDTGVTVTALKPGPTDTNFFHRAGMDNTEVGQEGKETNDPAEVAEQGFKALMNGDQEVFASSLRTKLEGFVGKMMPDSVKASQHEKMARQK